MTDHYIQNLNLYVDNRERQQACELLEDCKETIIIPLIGSSGLKVEVSGLEIMNDDPGKELLALGGEMKQHIPYLKQTQYFSFIFLV